MDKFEYELERGAFLFCLYIAKMHREAKRERQVAEWYCAAIAHRDNLRTLRRTGMVCPF